MTVKELYEKIGVVDAFVTSEGRSQRNYVDYYEMVIESNDDRTEIDIHDFDELPAKLKNAKVESFDVIIELKDRRFETSLGNKARAKDISLVISIEQ